MKLDLRRTYKPSPKFGVVNPLIYNVIVCPSCFYASFAEDFTKIDEHAIRSVQNNFDKRRKYAFETYGQLDFRQPRDLNHGAASFLLAVSSYTHFSKNFAPTTKRAIAAIRASWLHYDLHQEQPDYGWDKVYLYFRRLAWGLYGTAIQHAENGKETFDNVKKLGPDVDTDYGYEGALYILSLLGDEHEDYMSQEERYEKYRYYRSALAKVFGFGKSSKEKPGPMLIVAKDLHTKLHKKVVKLKEAAQRGEFEITES